MNITMLIENTSARDDLSAEHGLSLYIETKNHRILFDAGQSDAFADNAEKLGIDLSNVDIAVLSHGHYDHSGGLTRFLSLNDHAPVYMSKLAFGNYWHGDDHYIGIDQSFKGSGRIIFTDDECRIDDELSLYTCNTLPRRFPSSGAGLTLRKGDKFMQDEFLHEQYLMIEENGRRVLISGCSHKGILNIADWFKPNVLIGGFHFMKMDPSADRSALLDSAHRLLRHPTDYYTCHCTGTAQYELLRGAMGERLHYLSAGDRIILN